MFSVIFEVQPEPNEWDAYLGQAGLLRPELEQIDGFVDNIRYRSLTRPGWLLSLSGWRDEKSVIRWRTTMRHHIAQQSGRSHILLDYHLRVGEVMQDTHLPDGQMLQDQRLDETETGAAKTVTLVAGAGSGAAPDLAGQLGLDPRADGLVSWDVFEAILTPGAYMLLLSWRDSRTALAGRRDDPGDQRTRIVRIIRDYGMDDRREAPQYFPARRGRA